MISLLSEFVWAPTWRIATVVKAEVTWVKTKNTLATCGLSLWEHKPVPVNEQESSANILVFGSYPRREEVSIAYNTDTDCLTIRHRYLLANFYSNLSFLGILGVWVSSWWSAIIIDEIFPSFIRFWKLQKIARLVPVQSCQSKRSATNKDAFESWNGRICYLLQQWLWANIWR